MRHTDATKAKLSEMRRGKKNPFYGRKHTEENRRRMSEHSRRMNAQRRYVPSEQRIVLPTGDDRAYIAGLTDADGSIRFSGGRPFLAIYNTNRELIDWLVSTLGHGSVTNGNVGREQVLSWRISGACDVFLLVSTLRPLLIVKRSDADEALTFIREKYPEEVVEWERRLA